jgi:hypothetical protein
MLTYAVLTGGSGSVSEAVLNLLKTRLTPKRKLDRQRYGQPFTAVYLLYWYDRKKKILTNKKITRSIGLDTRRRKWCLGSTISTAASYCLELAFQAYSEEREGTN